MGPSRRGVAAASSTRRSRTCCGRPWWARGPSPRSASTTTSPRPCARPRPARRG
jgi:hypothetical protein